jgi:hypothetical protein
LDFYLGKLILETDQLKSGLIIIWGQKLNVYQA